MLRGDAAVRRTGRYPARMACQRPAKRRGARGSRPASHPGTAVKRPMSLRGGRVPLQPVGGSLKWVTVCKEPTKRPPALAGVTRPLPRLGHRGGESFRVRAGVQNPGCRHAQAVVAVARSLELLSPRNPCTH
jgi:hypothetical protein